MTTKVDNKVTLLSDTLKEFFGNRMNLARIKFFGLFISALCKVQTVCFEKLACSFDSSAQSDSSQRRIQRSISEYTLDTDLVAGFIFALLPYKPPYRLALDRTNWKFGIKNINIFEPFSWGSEYGKDYQHTHPLKNSGYPYSLFY